MQTTFTPRVEEVPTGVFLPFIHVTGWYQSKRVNHSYKVTGSANTPEGAMQLARMQAHSMATRYHRSSSKIRAGMR